MSIIVWYTMRDGKMMKHANRVNSVFCIEVIPFKRNVTYLIRKETLFMLVQCVYTSSRKYCNECAMLPCMLVFYMCLWDAED